MTIEDYSSLFATIRHYSHCSYYSLFATIRCSLFAIRDYSLFAIRVFQTPVVDRGGTENSHVAAIQRFLRNDSDDSFGAEKRVNYGLSVSNQRIEA